MTNAIAFRPYYLSENFGHGVARRKCLEECSSALIALMDADDISFPDRFEKQLHRFINDPALSVVGGQISEFDGRPDNITGIRNVPLNHDEIVRFAKKRCPMNQVSVMFKKNDVESAGGYQDWYCEEDYYLWLRMLESGYIFENTPDILVNVRTGAGMSSRRGGWKYFSSEAKLQMYMLKKGIINFPRFLYNVGIRFGGEVLVSNRIRQKLFSLMRTESNDSSVKKKESNYEIDNSTIDYPPFSVSMCVYGGDNPEWFDAALKSVIEQSVKPSEIVLVVDGPIPDTIQAVIDKYLNVCRGGGG